MKPIAAVRPVPNPSEPICILDDDASVLKALRRLLRAAGLPALTFNEARAFLRHAETGGMALAVIDVWMPELNGPEVQRRLREVAPYIPVIMMTGRDAPAARSAALAQGAVAFLVKPVAGEALLRAIREALGISR